MNTSPSSNSREPGLLEALVVTLVGIAAMYGIDSALSEATMSPVLGICILFLLALRYTPSVVGVCLLLLWAFVAIRLWSFAHIPQTPPMIRIWIRIMTFGAAGFIAMAAAAYRARLDTIIRQLFRILEAIPIPLLICDAKGYIRSASSETFVFSGLPKDSVIGFRLSEVVGTHLLEEAEEDWYEHWMQSPEGKIFDAELQLGTRRRSAKVGRIGSGNHAIMIVIFI